MTHSGAYDDNMIVDFTDRDLMLIDASLPRGIDQQRRDLLPRILRDWGCSDVPKLLRYEPEPLKIRHERFDRLSLVESVAKKLSEALAALDEGDHWQIILSLACPPECFPWGLSAREIERAQKDVEALRDCLPRFAAAVGNVRFPLTPRRGPARNDVPYLVLLDLAMIFEWLTGQKVSRSVDRDEKEESGPFYQFAAAVWPVLFSSGDDGLPSAMKNWATDSKKYCETTAVIGNINSRHPTWGIFNS